MKMVYCKLQRFMLMVFLTIFVLTLTGSAEVQKGFPNQTGVIHEGKRSREERLQVLKEARIPLTYEVPAGSKFELLGYVMGQTYQPAASGSEVIYGDRLNRYIPTYSLPEKFHGMDRLSCELTPITKRLYSMSLSRQDFTVRSDLMSEGKAVLESLGKALGYKLAPFKYEAPDWPYWPCEVWSGPIPDLFVADENQWATSKNVFAVSNTRIGDVSVKVRLGVVSFDHFSLSVTAQDEAVATEGQSEFDEDFKKYHDGQTFNEWSRERAFKRSPEYLKNEKRTPLPRDFKVAGHFLGERIDPVSFTNQFKGTALYYRETTACLPEKFIGTFSHVGIDTNSVGCISKINLKSDLMRSAKLVFTKYEAAREYLRAHGMDDYYEETVETVQKIQDFYEPNGKHWAWLDLCSLKWVDKSRSVEIELVLNVAKKDGMTIYLVVRQVSQDGMTDYYWRRGLDKIRNGRQAVDS